MNTHVLKHNVNCLYYHYCHISTTKREFWQLCSWHSDIPHFIYEHLIAMRVNTVSARNIENGLTWSIFLCATLSAMTNTNWWTHLLHHTMAINAKSESYGKSWKIRSYCDKLVWWQENADHFCFVMSWSAKRCDEKAYTARKNWSQEVVLCKPEVHIAMSGIMQRGHNVVYICQICAASLYDPNCLIINDFQQRNW